MSKEILRILTVTGFTIAGSIPTNTMFSPAFAEEQEDEALEKEAEDLDKRTDKFDEFAEKDIKPMTEKEIEEAPALIERFETKIKEETANLKQDDPNYDAKLDHIESQQNLLNKMKETYNENTGKTLP